MHLQKKLGININRTHPFMIKAIAVIKTTKQELANTKSFLLFFQKKISTKQSLTTNNSTHYRYLRKQRKY